MFAESIKGIQSAGVMACGKRKYTAYLPGKPTILTHRLDYIMNEQDHFRLVPDSLGFGFNISEPISHNVDDESLHELYLWPFADGVKAGMASIMCSYNQVCTKNEQLIRH